MTPSFISSRKALLRFFRTAFFSFIYLVLTHWTLQIDILWPRYLAPFFDLSLLLYVLTCMFPAFFCAGRKLRVLMTGIRWLFYTAGTMLLGISLFLYYFEPAIFLFFIFGFYLVHVVNPLQERTPKVLVSFFITSLFVASLITNIFMVYGDGTKGLETVWYPEHGAGQNIITSIRNTGCNYRFIFGTKKDLFVAIPYERQYVVVDLHKKRSIVKKGTEIWDICTVPLADRFFVCDNLIHGIREFRKKDLKPLRAKKVPAVMPVSFSSVVEKNEAYEVTTIAYYQKKEQILLGLWGGDIYFINDKDMSFDGHARPIRDTYKKFAFEGQDWTGNILVDQNREQLFLLSWGGGAL